MKYKTERREAMGYIKRIGLYISIFYFNSYGSRLWKR